jgi:hypothetical protein
MVNVQSSREPSPARNYFSIEVFPVLDFTESDLRSFGLKAGFDHLTILRFTDTDTTEETVAVIKSKSGVLVRKLRTVGSLETEHPDVTKRVLKGLLDRFAESHLRLSQRLNAELWYEGNGWISIDCRKPYCRFHKEEGCLNPKPMISDDCSMPPPRSSGV